MKPNRSISPSNLKTAVLAGLVVGQLALNSNQLWALPSGHNVTHGSATFQNSGSNLIIHQGTDKLITKWGSFSIAQGEKTQFIQPNKNSSALNRVIGGSRSIIDGQLSANGNVILINPAGVTVGPNGVVNVNSFTASTQDLADQDFIGGSLLYKGTSQESIENYGTVRATGGDAILIAKHVKNSGLIEAKNGTAALVGATEVYVMPAGETSIFVRPGSEKGATVTQSVTGKIAAASAHIQAAGNPWATAINLDGIVEVQGAGNYGDFWCRNNLVEGGGRVTVDSGDGNVAVGGTLRARKQSGSGGEIIVKGDYVGIASTGILDVDGGGTLYSFQNGASEPALSITSAGAVRIYANSSAVIYGKITAHGQGQGADGTVSVQARISVIMNGTVYCFHPIHPDPENSGPRRSKLLQESSAPLEASAPAVSELPTQPAANLPVSAKSPDQFHNDFQNSDWDSRFKRKSYLSGASVPHSSSAAR